MFRSVAAFAVLCGLSGCVTVPVTVHQTYRCELSTDQKTLRIVDFAKETNSYYDVAGLILSPILIPATAIVSGTYVLVNNTYNLGEEMIKCGDGKDSDSLVVRN